MRINRLSEALGAEVTGIDVSKVDADLLAGLKQALLEHCVLVFQDNRCTGHHALGGIPAGQIRHMHRTTIAGDIPF